VLTDRFGRALPITMYSHQNLDPKTVVHFLGSPQQCWPGNFYKQMLKVFVKR